ncbi:MAG: VWA domain-containing protein [Phycisphaerae bacterium]
MNFSFGQVHFLHLLWVIPALAGVYGYGFARKRRALQRFATVNLLGQLTPGVSWARQKVRAGLILASLVLLVVALAGPRWGERSVEVYRRGVDIMVVLDVSRSMLADDCRPNRLERARQYIKDLLALLPGDRVGLVCFAGKATLTCPLTPNYGWFRMALDEVDTDTAPRGGSNLAEAIRLAAQKLGERAGNHKAILLISDGEDQDSDPQFAARYALEDHGVRTFAIGLGDGTTGRPIPIPAEKGQTFVTGADGTRHVSKLNAALLESVAGIGGDGFAVPAGTADVDMAEFYERMVARLAPEEYEAQQEQRYVERYQWFAAGGLALLLMQTLMTERRAAPAKSAGRMAA